MSERQMEINPADANRAVHPDIVGKEPPTQFKKTKKKTTFVYVFSSLSLLYSSFLSLSLILYLTRLSRIKALQHFPGQPFCQCREYSFEAVASVFLSVRNFAKRNHDCQEFGCLPLPPLN